MSRQLGIVSHSFQTEVEVITVEEELGDVGEEWCARLKNLPTNITVERQKDEVGCIIYSCTLFYVLYILQASQARIIGETMIRAANKLAGGGGTATVTGEILDAVKMMNRMGNRLRN